MLLFIFISQHCTVLYDNYSPNNNKIIALHTIFTKRAGKEGKEGGTDIAYKHITNQS